MDTSTSSEKDIWCYAYRSLKWPSIWHAVRSSLPTEVGAPLEKQPSKDGIVASTGQTHCRGAAIKSRSCTLLPLLSRTCAKKSMQMTRFED